MTEFIGRLRQSDEIPYFQMARSAARDPNLTLEARGLLAVLLSLPADWQVVAKPLADMYGNCGEKRVRSLLRELVDHGYAKREQARDEHGRVGPMMFFVRPALSVGFGDGHQMSPNHPARDSGQIDRSPGGDSGQKRLSGEPACGDLTDNRNHIPYRGHMNRRSVVSDVVPRPQPPSFDEVRARKLAELGPVVVSESGRRAGLAAARGVLEGEDR